METETPTAAVPKRNLRWYQFSLRSLLIFVDALRLCLLLVRREVETSEGAAGGRGVFSESGLYC